MKKKPVISPLRSDLPPRSVADLDNDRLRRFWDWEWQDIDGNLWQVVNTDNQIGPGEFVYSSGDILYKEMGAQNFSLAGEWARFINIEGGYARHNRLEIRREELQGRGFGRAWLEHTARQYRDWNIKDVYLETDLHGATTWPKFGFTLDGPDDVQERQRQLDEIVHDIISVIDESQGDSGYRQHLLNLLKIGEYTYDDIISYDSELVRKYTHDLEVDFRARPEDILGSIRRRYHEPEIPGQTAMDF